MALATALEPQRVVTALEHQALPITEDGLGASLTRAEAERLARLAESRPGFCELGARQVRLAQYAGIVGLGDRVLEVLPKVDDSASSAEECRGVLLRLLGRTERFAHFRHQAAGQHLRQVPLLEVFIATFFDSVATLARGGLLRQYQPRHEDVAVVRGRIDLGRQFGANANRPDRLDCHFDELTADNPWNRVLKKALRCTRAWIRRADLHRRWAELMGVLDDVDDSGLAVGELDQLQFTRQAERYRDAVDWARWIIACLAPSLRAGAHEAPALLFDMNKLFESAVAAELRLQVRRMPGLSVDAQDNSRFLGLLVNGEHEESAYRLKPDLVLRRSAAVLCIADTKWKRVPVDRRGRLMPAEEDVYQMLAYAAAFGCPELRLIYPWHPGLANAHSGRFMLTTPQGGASVLRVGCVDVHDDALPLRMGDWLPGAEAL